MALIKKTELIPDDKNFNLGNEAGGAMIANSFKKFGAGRSILIDKNNKIIAGNKSTENFEGEDVLVIESDGSQLIAVKRTDIDLDTPEGREMALADNATAKANIVWAEDVIASELGVEVAEAWGVEFKDTGEAQEDDYVIPDEIETDIVIGDLFEIGVHRLLCMDSTNSDAVAKLMDGQKADMVFTDPPYGMNLDTDYSSLSNSEGKSNRYEKVKGDNGDFTPELINTIFSCFNDVKEIFIWGADYFAELIPSKNEGSWIVWDKRESETTGKNVDGRIGSMFELCWSKQKHKRLIARIMWAGMMGVKDDSKRVHPTQKPAQLSKWFFEQWGNENDLIADLFLGSGSTMVASHQLNRKCYGMELDPKYCQVIIDRMLKLDPTIKILKNGQPYETQ